MSTTDILDLVKKVKSEMPAGAFSPAEGKSLVYGQQQGGETVDPNSLTPEARDVLRLVGKIKQGSVAVKSKAAESSIGSQLLPKYDGREADRIADEAAAAKGKENIANRSEFTRGLLRGIDTLQATYEGGLGMYNAAMGNQEAANQRFANYQEQMRQASENPATVTDFFSTDPKTGAFASPGNFGTYVAGTLGQAVPSLTEAVASGIAGAAIGAAIVPAPDPADVVTIPAGAIGGFLGRNAMKRAIASASQQYAQRGVAKDVAEQMADRYVRQAVANRIASNVGSGLAVSQTTAFHEGGGMYAEGLEQGYNAPGSAIALGQVSGFSEALFGAAPSAVRAVIGKTALNEAAKEFGWKQAAGYAWDILKNAGEEGVQEGFQEFLGSVNQSINDPKFKLNSKENFMQWAEAAAAGAVTGGVVGGGTVSLQAIRDRKRQLEEIRNKKFVSETDAQEAGIAGESRRERMDNLNAEMEGLDQQEADAIRQSDEEFINQQQQAQAPQPQSGVQPEQFAEVPIPEDGGMTDEEYAAFRQAQMGAQGGNVSTPPPTATPTVPPVAPQPTVQPPQVQPQQPAAVQPSQAPGTVEPTDISKATDALGKGAVDGLYIKIWNDVQSGSLQKMDKPPLFEQLVLRGYNGGVVRSLEDVRSIQDGMTGDFETDKVVGVNNLNKLASKYQGQQPAAGQPPVAPPLPALTPEQADQSDRGFAERQASEQGPVAPQVPESQPPATAPLTDREFAEQKAAEQGLVTPQAPVIKQKLKNAIRFAPDTAIPEGVPFVKGKHPAFGDYIEVSTANVNRIPGYSPDLPSQGDRPTKVESEPESQPSPEGKTEAFRSLPEKSRSKFESAWESNDPQAMKALLHSSNKVLRAEFNNRTGEKLPRTAKGTDEVIERVYRSRIKRETVNPAVDKQVGKNAAGEQLYERENGDRYRWVMNRKDRPNGYPDFGGDLSDAKEGRRYASIYDAIVENGGYENNSTDDVEAIRNKLYDGADTPTGTEIRAVMNDMRVEAGRKLESEQQKPTEPTDAVTAPTEPPVEQPEQPEGVDAALRALDAMLASEKPKEPPKPRSVRKEPEKTKQGQYVLPLMPGMAAEIDRQDFVRRYRDRALEPLWGWSNKEEDAEGIQATIDTLAPIYSEIFNDIYAGKRETIDDVYDSEPYERILKLDDDAIAVGDALMINRLDEQIKAALQDYPKKEAKRPPRKSEQTLKEAKSDMQAAHDAAAAAMEKIRNKLMSGIDPEISAEVVRVAYLYTKAGVKTFKGYVEAILENFGDTFAREFAPYMEDGWTALNIRKLVSDPTGKVEDYLEKETTDGEQQGELGTDQDLPVGDGTGEPQGDGARGDTANDAERDSQKGTRQEGDQVLPTDGETTGVDGRGGSKGDGADGGVDTNQPEQGPTDGADAGGGVADGAMEERLAVNHVISSDDDLAVASVTESLKRNIKALQILKKLEADGRFPDESERKSLAQYTGWGGLSQALDSIKGERMLQESWGRDENWEKKWGASYVKLKELLTKEELQAAQSSTENAHYTSKEIIQSLWKIAERLGYTGGRVLELGAGVGHFAGLVPAQFRGVTQFTMVEMDSISSRIAKMLYPTHDVIAGDMQQFKAVPGSVTIGIGNVPFAGGTVPDSNKRYGEPLNLHNYSIARHLDALAPGGVVVVISSHNTLDSNIKQRKFLASKGELIGAIRLPNDAFASNAKTEVVTDILVFRRPRQGDPSLGTRFDQNADIAVKNKDGKDVAKQINRYFADNPEMVLGVHSAKGSMYTADEYTVESTPGDLQDKINAAIEKLPRDILGTVSVAESVVAANASIPFGRLEIRDGVVVMGYGDTFTPIAGKTFEGFPADLTGKTGLARAKDFITLRESLASARETMLSEDASDEDVKKAQRKLNDAYDKYVKKHGNLSERKTSIFKRDPDYYRVLSLENETGEYDPASKKIVITYNKAAIFTERVLGPQKEPTSAATPADAMSVSLAWKGAIDSVYIGRLLGLDASKAEAKLIEERLAFRNPATTQLEMSDLYLSGNVRSKLEQAKIIAEEDPQYQRNVDALEKVMPEPVTLKKDTVRLGATWIPENVVAAFATQAFGTNTGVSYNANTDSWTVGDPYDISETARARYQTERIRPNEILAELLNLRSIKVFDKVETGEYDTSGRAKTTQVLNEKETQAAKHRASVMRADFGKWVLENREVSQVLAKIYNDKYNNFVRAKYNGDFLTLPGSNPEVKLRPYQKDAIWRIINRGTALLAHAVGSGKTYTMIGAAMEMRRLGIARRPLLVVQNATLGQFATSFQKMYPNAKVLVATKDDLGKGKRKLFLNKISTGNWDAVVMAQSTLDNMASEERVERAFIQDQIDLLEEAIREEGGAFAKTPTVKQLARQKKSLQDRFDKLMGSRAKKEDNVVFEDLGVDALFLDEAHAYKKPTFATKLSNLVGLNTESSAKSLATMIKVRSVQSANNGRNVILATGTPVTNTLGEAWHMVNYVSPATNAAFNARTFDQFISNFAMVEPTLTMNAGGQYVYKDAIVKFRNGRQLVEHINESWDIVTPEHLRAYMENNKKGFPVLRNGKLTAITVERTPGVASFMGFIERVYSRYKSLPAKERRALSFIPALAYGASKAATLDIRLVMPNAAEEKNSKLQRAAEEVKRIYDETSDSQGTQLFFSDTKNPYSMDRLNQFMSGEAIDAFEVDSQVEGDVVAVEEQSDSDSFLYQELKRKLLAMGVPSEQIAFISDATTDAKRQALFQRVNNGDVRVLIGSTSKMGVGVNVQQKLAAIHHFDTPWLPADLEQREGRILRFGNENEVVEVLRYAMKKTLDGAIYMGTSRKQKFIWQVLNGQIDSDTFDDPSSASMLSIEEQLAAIQDDPIFLEKIEVQNRLRELELERQSFFDAQQRVAESLRNTESDLRYRRNIVLPQLMERLDRINEVRSRIEDAGGSLDAFTAKIDGKDYTDPKKADEAIKAKLEDARRHVGENFDKLQTIDKAGGILSLSGKQLIKFTIGPASVAIGLEPAYLQEKNDEGKDTTRAVARVNSIAYLIEPRGDYIFYAGNATVPATFFEKMGLVPKTVQSEIAGSEERIVAYEAKIAELKALLDKQWEDEPEYQEKRSRLSEIETLMLSSGSSLSEKKPGAATEEDQDGESDLDNGLRNPPPLLMQTEPDIYAGFRSQAMNLGLAAEKAGITAFEDFVAHSVKTIGTDETYKLGAYLRRVGEIVGMTGIRPVKDILGVPMTPEEYVQLGKQAFAGSPQVTPEQVEAGIEVAMLTGLPQMAAGFAPAGSPMFGQSLMQGDFDQPANYEFTESDYRPAVVSYARDKWGSAVAANGKPTWQNFVRWFDDSAVVDKDGKPLVVYHGGARTIDDNIIRTPFFYMTANRSEAEYWAGENGRVHEVYLKFTKPYRDSQHDDRFMDTEERAQDYDQDDPEFAERLREATREAVDRMNELKGQGYNSIVMQGEADEDYDNFIAFDPTQIKSATGNRGTFDPNNPNMLYQEEAPRWYLKSRNLIQDKMGPKATSEQVLGMLRKNGVSDEELYWSGLEELLGSKQSVAKDEVLAAINNGMQVDEVSLPKLQDIPSFEDMIYHAGKSLAASRYPYQVVINRLNENDRGSGNFFGNTLEEAMGKAKAKWNEVSPTLYEYKGTQTKFGQYTLPGGENYKELLITRPDTAKDKERKSFKKLGELDPNTPEYDAAYEQHKADFMAARNAKEYKSQHWDQPNVLAHIRFNERTDADGKRVMFIEEVQSDWHQEGRKKGYEETQEQIATRLRTLDLRPVEIGNRRWQINNKDGEKIATVAADDSANAIDKYARLIFLQAQEQSGRVPDAPFKKSWSTLAMKRAIQYAAENGFDRIAWTTGEQQADRYDLSKQVDRISYGQANGSLTIEGTRDSNLYVEAKVEDGLIVNVAKGTSGADLVGKQLEDVVGKEIADKLLNGKPNNQGYVEIQDDGLKVGGEGMKAFYDEMLPNETNKLIKKFGVKVGDVLVVTSADQTANDTDENGMAIYTPETMGVNGFDITPAMRESALQYGQTLFQQQSQGGNVKGWTKFISGTRALIGATNKADISTVIHEYAHVIRRFLLDRDVPQDQRIDITDEEISMLEEKCGVKDGNWDVPAEEKFAKMWEQYFFEGKSPNTLLDSLFEKISRWMQQVYQSAMSITGGTLDPEVRKLFDKMVQRQLPADQRTGTKSQGGGKDKPPIYLPVTSDQWGDNLTSLANAAANATREKLKLPSLTEPASEGFQEWLDAAVVIMRNDPTYANRLVKELQQSSRTISDIDVAVLNLHYRHLKNLSDAAAKRLFKAIDDKQGDVAIVEARRESDALINEIEDFTDMTKKVGTEAGRALVARKIALAEDYTLGNLLLKARVANAGQPLSEEQLQEVRELADKIAKLEGDLAKEIQEKDDLARKLAAKESIDDTQKQVGKPVRNTATNRAVKKVESFVSKFVNIFGKRDDTTTLQQTEDEQMAEDGEEVIKSFVEAGVYSFGEFMSKFKAVIKGDVPVAARAALRKAWEKLKAQGDIPAPEMSDERQTTELRRLAKMVERNLVEFGITDPEEVIDGVHEALQEVFEDVTRREAMDAMSGYGQYSTPSQEPNDKIIRDLNAQFQQMAKLDDMKQGIAPKKSGRGRDEPSPELRELIREVNEMKRNSKYFVTDPEAQLKTIFQATRTALRNRIYDLNKAIKTKEPIPGRTPNTFEGEQAKEIESLRKRRDELMADYKATFPKPGLTFEQRAAIAERAVDREITKIEQQLASGNVAAKERAEPVSTPALKDKQNRLESLRAQREAVREMQMTDADKKERAERLERQAEKAYVANLLNRIADYEDRKAQGYFGPKPKKEPRALSPREIELSRQLVNLKDEFFRYAAEYRLKNMSKVERFWDRTKETMHLSRAIMTSFDLSAVFRQGGIASLAHPRLAGPAIREMLAALRRGDGEFDTMDKISKDELYALAMRAGLSITTDSGKITRQEEAYMGRWAKWGIGKKGTKINELSLKALFFVAPSARAYTTFLNSMRFRVFKYMVSNLGAGGEVTIDEAKVIASYVNAATGRAELGKFNQAAANLNTVFFAPRYVTSRFQYLAMPFYLLPSTKVSGRVKKMIAMEYARHAMGLTAFLGLSVALASLLTDDEEEKPTVEFDPRSSDFMKLKIGDTRIDPMAGLSQTVTLIGQMATGQKKGLRGDIKDLYGENRKFGDPDLWDVGTGFLRKKLAPIPGAIVDLRVGENVIGEKETVLSATTDLFVPLSFQEAGETMKARGLVGGAVVTALSLLGMGGGTYGPKTQYATADTAKREELFKKDLENVKWNDPDLAYKDFLTTAQLDKFNKQREGRKQSLVFSAAADPKRKDYNSDETFKKSVEERDKALEAVIKAGMGPKETQLLLIAYYKRNYGSAYEVRGGVYQMKESLANRLRTIRRKLNEKKTPTK